MYVPTVNLHQLFLCPININIQSRAEQYNRNRIGRYCIGMKLSYYYFIHNINIFHFK